MATQREFDMLLDGQRSIVDRIANLESKVDSMENAINETIRNEVGQSDVIHNGLTERITRIEEQNKLLRWMAGIALGGMSAIGLSWVMTIVFGIPH